MINLTGSVLVLIQGRKPRGIWRKCDSFEHAEFVIHRFCKPMKLETWQKETLSNNLLEEQAHDCDNYRFTLYDNEVLAGLETF